MKHETDGIIVEADMADGPKAEDVAEQLDGSEPAEQCTGQSADSAAVPGADQEAAAPGADQEAADQKAAEHGAADPGTDPEAESDASGTPRAGTFEPGQQLCTCRLIDSEFAICSCASQSPVPDQQKHRDKVAHGRHS